jgi:hypothetical protein
MNWIENMLAYLRTWGSGDSFCIIFHLFQFLLATCNMRDWGKCWFRVEKNENIYLSHMEYEGSIGFETGLFIAKNMIWEKKNPSVTRRRRRRCDTKFVPRLQPPSWRLESWNFGYRSLLGQLAPHTQNFEIWHLKGTSHTNFD